MSRESNSTLFWVPLPPPYSGPAVGSALLMAEVVKRLPDAAVENATCRPTNMAKGHFDSSGVWAFFKSYTHFVGALCRTRCRVFYMVIAPGIVGFLRDAVLIWTAALLGKKIVLHLRGGNYDNFYRSSPSWLRPLIRRTWGLASRAIVQSEGLAGLLDASAPHVPISVLPNGLPPSEVPPDRERDDSQPVTFLFLGYLSFTKGFYDLMVAYKALHRRHRQKVRLVFAGERPQGGTQFVTFLSDVNRTAYLKNLAALEAEINEFVDDAGRYNAKYESVVHGAAKDELLKRADVFVLPSYMEGFSMAILEAMFAGLPIVTTPVGSNPDIIRPEVNGLLVGTGETVALEAALSWLVERPDERRRMGATNAAEARAKYALPEVADKMVQILAQV